MEPKIEDFSRETFRYKMPHLLVSPSGLTIDVQTGNTVTGSFVIESESASSEIRAYLTVHDCYMSLNTVSFAASRKVITWRYDAGTLPAGISYSGLISVISDHGEKTIPYSVNVTEKKAVTSNGEISELFDLAALAKDNFSEAAEVFLKNDFPDIFLASKPSERHIWECLRRDPDREHALDTFLCLMHKKFPVKIFADKESFEFHLAERSVSDNIVIHRSTWGWTHAQIYSTAPFIICDKNEISSADFTDNTAYIKFTLDPQLTGAAKDTGSVIIENHTDRIEIKISLINVSKKVHSVEVKRRRLINFKKAAESYFKLQTGQSSLNDAATGIRSYLYGMDIEGDSSISELADIYLGFLAGNTEDARNSIASLKVKAENEKEYLCLDCLLTDDENRKKQDLDRLREIASESSDWKGEFLLLCADKRISSSPEKKYEALRKIFNDGVRSLFIYGEVLSILKNDDSLFNRLDSFLLHAFAFGAVRGFIPDQGTLDKYVYLAGEYKNYEPLLLNTLKKYYSVRPGDEILTAICTQILLKDHPDRTDHDFLAKGVRRGLRLSGLYEEYLNTLDQDHDEEIIPAVFTYFRYDDHFTDEKRAQFYAYIIKHKDEGSVYKDYVTKIRQFAEEQVKYGNISSSLSVIYRDCLKDRDFVNKNSIYFPNIIFKAELKLEKGKYEGISVFYDEMKEPVIFSELDSVNYIDIFGNDSIAFFTDKEGRLYPASECGSITKLFTPAAFCEESYNAGSRDARLICELVYECEKLNRRLMDKNAVLGDAMKSDGISEGFRLFVMGILIKHYYEIYDGDTLERLLSGYDLYEADRSAGEETAKLILVRNMYPLGVRAVKYLGHGRVDKKYIARITEQMVEDNECADKAALDDFSYYLLRHGKSSDNVLIWLREHHEGTMSEMTELFLALKKKDLLTEDYAIKVAEQILFTEELPVITGDVYAAIDHDKHEVISKAMLNYAAYRLLTRDREPAEVFKAEIKKEALAGNDRLFVLACLKLLSAENELTSAECEFAILMLGRLTEEGITLPFFKDFIGKCDVPAEIVNRTFVMIAADDNDAVSIHYRTFSESRTDAGYTTELMKNVFKGIFVKDFLIFADESVQYFITVDHGDGAGERVFESGTLEYNDSEGIRSDDGGSLFSQLNSVFVSANFGDDASFREYLLKYVIERNMIESIFKYDEE